MSVGQRKLKKKNQQATIIVESVWESLIIMLWHRTLHIFWLWLFRQCDQTWLGTILKRFRYKIFYVCIGGIITWGRMGWRKSQRPKVWGGQPPTLPAPQVSLHILIFASLTHCSWMYKLDLAEILKTTISMELGPVKMVHDLVTLTCINLNEQANKSLH